jgi:hypothetical protein
VLESLEERLAMHGEYLGTPFLGRPIAISPIDPIKIEAERFDNGGPGVAYVDLDGRLGLTTFRPGERVDIWTGTTDGAEGQSVFDFRAGESMAYTVDVPMHGEYDVSFRVSSPAVSGSIGAYFHLEAESLEGHDHSPTRSPLVVVPGSGNAVAWSMVTVRGVHLHEGPNVLRLVSDFGTTSIDWFQLQPASHVHGGDPSAADEHHQLEELLPAGEATHVALRSGNWSDPSNWSFGVRPSAGSKIWIPEGVTITYDVDWTTPIQSIRVDGTFRFSTTTSTQLFVDTIAVLPTGVFEHGTPANPIGPNLVSSITFTDAGPIDRTADPTELGRGLISHGKVTIAGAEKSTQGWLRVNPLAGSRTLSLATVPAGWRIGDEIIIAGAKSRPVSVPSNPSVETPIQPTIAAEDEVRRVVSISGSTITLDRPLSFDHVPPAGLLDAQGQPLRIYVANTTRSIRYRSANTSYANNADIHRHGHVMLMHSDKVAVQFAEFRDLGRTNKSISIDDVLIEPISNQQIKFTAGTGSNVRGRYALHLHKTGIDGQRSPIVVRGNAVVGGPGWGYVNHQSNVEFYDNVAFDVPGAAFVEEDGTGIGSFRGNIAIGSRGTGRLQPFNDDGDLRDMGFAGHGFFFRGNATIAEDNVVFSAAHSGFAWSNKGEERVIVNELAIPADSLLYPEIALGGKSLDWQSVPTKFFRRNMVASSGSGIQAGFWMQPASTKHDGRNEIRDFTAWNLTGQEGTRIHYTRALTWINARIYRDPSLATRGQVGILADVNASGDHVFDNVKVVGFETGLVTKPLSNGIQQRYLILDNSDFATGNGRALADPTNVLTIARSTVAPASSLQFIPNPESMPSEGGINVGLYIAGTKTDSLGIELIGGRSTSTARFLVGGDQLRYILSRGYFQDAQGTYIVVPILITDRLTLDIKVVPVRIPFNPNGYSVTPLGPNLGVYAGTQGRAFRQANAGGPAAGGFQADFGFTGGTTVQTSLPVSTELVRRAASPAVYQSARRGPSTYTLTGLSANSTYTVRLHFADIEQSQVGKRLFDVIVQGVTTYSDFDIVAAAGAGRRAVVREITTRANAAGVIQIQFVRGGVGEPLVNGVEILDQIASLVTSPPKTGLPPGSYVESEIVPFSSATPGAVIYYTLDGSTPTPQSTRYTKPILVNRTTTIRSIAIAPGLRSSEVVDAVFAIQPARTPYRINFGGPAVDGFSSDIYTTGYTRNIIHDRPINTSAPGAGPAAIYQSSTTIWTDYDMWSILPNLTPGKTYTLRLHFAEPVYSRAGDRRFDVWVNGAKRLSAFDIVAEAGGRDIAVVKDVVVQADRSGRIYLFLEGSSGNYNRTVLLNALEVIDPSL